MRKFTVAAGVLTVLAGCGGGGGTYIPEGIDLMVSSITAPINCGWGADIDIDVVLRNRGKTESLATWTVEVRFSDDTVIDATDALLATYTVDGLAAQTDLPKTDSVAIPGSGVDGLYYIGYMVDTGDDEEEEVENNNVANKAIYVGAATMPDFTVSNIVVPVKILATRGFPVYVDVSNQAVPFYGTLKLSIYVSTDAVITPADTQIGNDVYVTNLDYMASTQVHFWANIPNRTTGHYYVGVYVDAAYEIPEENEANNTVASIMYVGYAYPASDAYEPDNIGQYATLLTLGGSAQTHTFTPGTDEDWFTVNIPGPGTFRVIVDDTGGGDADVYIFSDPDGNNLLTLGWTYGSEDVSWYVGGATQLWLMVDSFDQKPNATYTIRVMFTP